MKSSMRCECLDDMQCGDHAIIPFPFAQSAEAGCEDSFPRIIPLAVVHQIDRELETNRYNPRTVMGACQGLERGSARFEKAYLASRIEVYARQRALSRNPLAFEQPIFVTTLPAVHDVWENHLHPFDDADAVLHGGHLMNHIGVWIVALLAVQILSAWNIGAFASLTLGGPTIVHAAAGLLLMGLLNVVAWLRYGGKPAGAFHLPATILFLMAALPGVTLPALMALQSAS